MAKTSDNGVDKALLKFAEVIINRLQTMEKSNYTQPWFNVKAVSFPQNLSGRRYNSRNAIMLFFLCEAMKYKASVFMTFHQTQEIGVKINKGESAFPVYYPIPFIVNNLTRERISLDEYNKLSKEQKEDYTLKFTPKYYNVFNVQQTNFAEIYPQKMAEFLNEYEAKKCEEGELFTIPVIDSMLNENGWVCPINVIESNEAYYSLSKDAIYMPLKGQFKQQEKFYSTLLHEMTHSTGVESRCNRYNKKVSHIYDYGVEELVAEFTAALTGVQFGLNSTIQSDSIPYLKGWCDNLKSDPKIIVHLLADVSRAENYICNKLGIEIDKSKYIASTEEISNDVKTPATRCHKSALLQSMTSSNPQKRRVTEHAHQNKV